MTPISVAFLTEPLTKHDGAQELPLRTIGVFTRSVIFLRCEQFGRAVKTEEKERRAAQVASGPAARIRTLLSWPLDTSQLVRGRRDPPASPCMQPTDQRQSPSPINQSAEDRTAYRGEPLQAQPIPCKRRKHALVLTLSPHSVRPAMHMPRGGGIAQRARPVRLPSAHARSSAHGADMVGESRNMSDDVLFTQALIVLMPPTIC